MFIPGKPFQPSLTNTKFENLSITDKKSFITLAPGCLQRAENFLVFLSKSSTQSRQARGQCFKTFYGRKLRLFMISQSVVPCKPFQPSLMFAGKARAYLSEAPFQVLHSRVGSWPQAPGLRLLASGSWPRLLALGSWPQAYGLRLLASGSWPHPQTLD